MVEWDAAPELPLLHAARPAVSATAAAAEQALSMRRWPRLSWCGRSWCGLSSPAASAAEPGDLNIAVTYAAASGGESGSEPAWRLVTRPPSPVAVVACFGDHLVADGAHALDSDLDDVTGLHPDGRLAREAHAAWRPCGYHVTWPKP